MRTVLKEFHVGGLFRSGNLALPWHNGPRDAAPHWIYFVQGDDGGAVKIGRSCISPFRRIEALQQGYPYGRLRVVALVRATGVKEKELHARFAASRLRGEWYSLTPDLVALVREIQDAGPEPLLGRVA